MTLTEARVHLYAMLLSMSILIPLWLTNHISDRHMIGITLFLSLYAPAIEARNGIRLAKEKDSDGN